MILLTGIEYMREEADEKEKTQTAWQDGQKRGKTVNWSNGIKTFGEINSNNTLICTTMVCCKLLFQRRRFFLESSSLLASSMPPSLLPSTLTDDLMSFEISLALSSLIYDSIAACFYFD